MTSSETTLSILLDRIRAELETLRHITCDMQTGLTPLLIGISDHDADAYRHAQNIDLVTQTLESLSAVVHAVARDEASRLPIDVDTVAKALPLAALGARLRGIVLDEPGDDDELDLF